MPIEHVTRSLSFDNLVVDVTVVRYICDYCGRREAFHDTPPAPYGTTPETPESRGWGILRAWFDGEEGAQCAGCIASAEQRSAAARDHSQGGEG